MTPSERDTRLLDGLMASQVLVHSDLADHGARLTALDREMVAQRAQGEKAIESLIAALQKVDDHCAARVQAVRDDIQREAERAEERKERLQLTKLQKFGLALAAAGPILTAVGLVVAK